jgi:glycosyltransferase involved in cell wall biosynthesis
MDIQKDWTGGWYDKAMQEKAGHQAKSICVIGYQGSSSHAGDVEAAGQAISIILRRYPYVKFMACGWDWKHKGKDYLANAPHDQIIYKPWTLNMQEYLTNAACFDIGIAPLRDTYFNRCKSNIKVLEYYAMGTPVVASKLEPYQDDVIEGETGYLVKATGKQVDRWVKALNKLVTDHNGRYQMGKACRDYVVDKYSSDKWASRWSDVYETVIKDNSGRIKNHNIREIAEGMKG